MYVYKKCCKTLLNSKTQQQPVIAVRSPQLTVPWTTVKMSTCSTTRQQQLGIAIRNPQSGVPRTTTRTSTCSIEQQQLREAAACLPALDPYGYRIFSSTTSSASDSTPGGILTGWQRIITESDQRQHIISLSPTWSAYRSCRKCVQLSTEPLHQTLKWRTEMMREGERGRESICDI